MVFVGHTQVHHRQHHKNEGLQGDDQNMEDGPAELEEATEDAENQAGAVHGGDQDEDHLTGKHVAEESQGEGERLGQHAHHFHEQVHGNERPVVEGVQGEILDIAGALDLEAVADHQRERSEGHAGGDVDAGGGPDLEVDMVAIHAEHMLAKQLGGVGNQVDRDEVHKVHQEYPDEHGEG